MKNNVVVLGLALSSFIMSVPSFADHTTDNAGTTAQLAYRLADTAESLERYAGQNFRPLQDGSGSKDIESTVERVGGDEVLDHRGENLDQLSYVARRLHLAASDLYRTARSGGRGFGPKRSIDRGDEGGEAVLDFERRDGNEIRYVYDRVRAEYQSLRRYYANLSSYTINQNIHYLVRDIDQAYASLEWSVYGIRN